MLGIQQGGDRPQIGPAFGRRALLAAAGLGIIGGLRPREAAAGPVEGVQDAFWGAVNALSSALAPRAGEPAQLVNGDFSYPGYTGYIDPVNGQYNAVSGPDGRPTGMGGWHAIPGWSFGRFGWRSSQPYVAWDPGVSTEYVHAQSVQVSKDESGHGLAELVCHSPDNSIYQDISTVPGSVYIWQLRHRSTYAQDTDQMSVMIGRPGSESAQRAYRKVSLNGANQGYVGTVISTSRPWTAYGGTYLCPSGQTVTRFTFQSIRGHNGPAITEGNQVTDITFRIAYPLRYDANGGSGSLPSPSADANGIYQGYYCSSTRVTVTSSKPSRSGHTFMGWSESKVGPLTSKAALDAAKVIGSTITMPASAKTLYAVWGKNPTITTYVVYNGKTTAIASKSVAFGSSFNPSSDSWAKSALSQAAGKAGAPSGAAAEAWWPSSSCTGGKQGQTTLYSNLSIYAKIQTTTVIYYADGEEVHRETVAVGVRHTPSSTATSKAKRPGCTPGVEHWYASNPSTDPSKLPSPYTGQTTGTSTIKLYTRNWCTVTAYVVFNGKTTRLGSLRVAYGSSLTPSSNGTLTSLRNGAAGASGAGSGAVIDSWWTSSSCSGSKAGTMTVKADVSLYCRPRTAQVKYYRDDESSPFRTETAVVGVTFSPSSAATSQGTRTGCTPGFEGWYASRPPQGYASARPAKYAAKALPDGGLSLYCRNFATLSFATTSNSDDLSGSFHTSPDASSPLAGPFVPGSRVLGYGVAASLSLPATRYRDATGADGTLRWQTYRPSGYYPSSAGTGSTSSRAQLTRDTTLYVRWERAVSDGVEGRLQ